MYIDTNDDIGEANNNISGTVLEEIQAMFKFLKGKIDALEADNIILKAEIEALKQGQIVVPDQMKKSLLLPVLYYYQMERLYCLMMNPICFMEMVAFHLLEV